MMKRLIVKLAKQQDIGREHLLDESGAGWIWIERFGASKQARHQDHQGHKANEPSSKQTDLPRLTTREARRMGLE